MPLSAVWLVTTPPPQISFIEFFIDKVYPQSTAVSEQKRASATTQVERKIKGFLGKYEVAKIVIVIEAGSYENDRFARGWPSPTMHEACTLREVCFPGYHRRSNRTDTPSTGPRALHATGDLPIPRRLSGVTKARSPKPRCQSCMWDLYHT